MFLKVIYMMARELYSESRLIETHFLEQIISNNRNYIG